MLSFFFLLLLLACSNTSSKGAKTQIKALDIAVIDLPERHYLVFRERLPLDNMTGFFGIESKALAEAAEKAGIKAQGPPTGLFYEWNESSGIGEAAVALPVAAGTKLSPYVLITLPPTKAFEATLAGDYTGLGAIHYGLNAQFQAQPDLKPLAPSIEEYIKGPLDGVEEKDFVTRVLYPIQ